MGFLLPSFSFCIMNASSHLALRSEDDGPSQISVPHIAHELSGEICPVRKVRLHFGHAVA
jgi:hypothetical protein